MKKVSKLLLLLALATALLLTGCKNDLQDETTVTTGPDQTKQTEDTTAQTGGDETPLVIFPDAPEKAAIKALPETYDVGTLVTPYWAAQFKKEGAQPTFFYISIPQIYPFSEDAVACQQEIYQLYAEKAEWPFFIAAEFTDETALADKPEDIFFRIDQYEMCYSYHTGIYQDVLSITVRINGTDVPWSYYYTYYLDLTTGKRLTQEEANAGYAVDKADIKGAVEAYYRQMNEAVDEKLDYYQDNLKKTVADENIDACRLFCTEDGKLMLVAEIYGAGSVEKTQKLIELPE